MGCSILRFLRLLCLALLMSLPSLLNLCYLALYVFVGRSFLLVLHTVLKGLQAGAYQLSLLLGCLALLDFLDSILNAAVALVEQLLSLSAGLSQNLLALALHLLETLLVMGDGALKRFLAFVDGRAFLLPIALVAHDILQILVALYIIAAHDVAGPPNHLFGQSYLAGYLDGERAAGASNGQLEERPHLVAVVKHGTVGYTIVTVGKMLQVLVVGGDDRPGLMPAELIEYALGYGTSYLGLGAGAELVNEQQGAPGGVS